MTLEITMPGQPPLKFHADNIVSQREGKLRVRFEKIYRDLFISMEHIDI